MLWWSDYEDHARHRAAAGLLDRCRATNTCPKIFETFGGVEFWFLRESPDLVGTDAKADIPLPPNVRRYFFPGTTHGGGRGGFSAAAPAPPNGCVLPANPNPETDTMRALTAALIDWVTKGTEPPPSRYPRLDQHWREAKKAAIGFPDIPGVPSPDGLVNPVYDFDFGPDFNYNDESGPDHEAAARHPAGSADAGAEGGCRRQRRGRRAFPAAPGAAGNVPGLERDGCRVRQGQGLPVERRLHSVRAGRRRSGWRPAIRASRSRSATAATKRTWRR